MNKLNTFNANLAFDKIVGPNMEQEKNIAKGRPKEDREIKVRKSFAVFPSTYENAQKIAYIERESISEIIGAFLEDYVNKNMDKIKEYDNIKKK